MSMLDPAGTLSNVPGELGAFTPLLPLLVLQSHELSRLVTRVPAYSR
jgi:hypothetical protein